MTVQTLLTLLSSHWTDRSKREWTYRFFGPTTLHLKHEFYLWLSLSILSISSLQSVYRKSFGLSGDYFYCILASLWLSRHLLLRCLCTRDTSTLRSPTLTGIIVHWITSLVMVGQYLDRPDAAVVAKHAGTTLHGIEDDTPTFSVIPSLTYTILFLKMSIWYPLLHATTQGNQSIVRSQRRHSRERSGKHNEQVATTQQINHPWIAVQYPRLVLFWHNHGLRIQPMMVILVFVSIIWNLIFTPHTQSLTYASTMASSITASDYTDTEIGAYGVYEPLKPISWARIFFLMSCASTLSSIIAYGRITLPIPDLVAGSNVIKAVRNEVRGNSQQKSSKSKYTTVPTDMAWNEHYKPISTENRFRLSTQVAILRIVDAVVTCIFLTRTSLVCRATKHCPESSTWWELAMILYRPQDIKTFFSTLQPDTGATFIAFTSVIMITILLLLAQLVTLEKSYLAIMGYISGEWKLVPGSTGSVTAPSQWNSRRRYKKGDLIIHSFPGFQPSIYMATSNFPEGRPFDLSLRATHDMFRQDLGHVSTSMVISYCSSIHTMYMVGIVIMGLYYTLKGFNTSALVTAFVANLVASFGLVHVGLMDYDELQSISKEINGH
jgi:hypothetical protein